MCTIIQVLFHTSEQHQQHCFFDHIMPPDRRCKRFWQDIKDVSFLRQFVDFTDIDVRNNRRSDASTSFCAQQANVIANNNGSILIRVGQWFCKLNYRFYTTYIPENRTGLVCVSIAEGSINTNNADTISRLCFVDQIVIQNNIDWTWQLTCRCSFGHFLNADRLVVAIYTVSKLGHQGIAIIILGWIHESSRDGITGHGGVSVLARVMSFSLFRVVNRSNYLGSYQGT